MVACCPGMDNQNIYAIYFSTYLIMLIPNFYFYVIDTYIVFISSSFFFVFHVGIFPHVFWQCLDYESRVRL